MREISCKKCYFQPTPYLLQRQRLVLHKEDAIFYYPHSLWSLARWHNGNTLRTCHQGQSQVSRVKRKRFFKPFAPLEGSDPRWQKWDSRHLQSAVLWKRILHNCYPVFPWPWFPGTRLAFFFQPAEMNQVASPRCEGPGCTRCLAFGVLCGCSLYRDPLPPPGTHTCCINLKHSRRIWNNVKEGERWGGGF